MDYIFDKCIQLYLHKDGILMNFFEIRLFDIKNYIGISSVYKKDDVIIDPG